MLLVGLIGAGWLDAIVMCCAICAAVKRIDTEISVERALTGTADASRSSSRRPHPVPAGFRAD